CELMEIRGQAGVWPGLVFIWRNGIVFSLREPQSFKGQRATARVTLSSGPRHAVGQGLGRFEYFSNKRLCRLSVEVSCPLMKRYFRSVVSSSGSPLVTMTLAILPVSRVPTWSASPKICAG